MNFFKMLEMRQFVQWQTLHMLISFANKRGLLWKHNFPILMPFHPENGREQQES